MQFDIHDEAWEELMEAVFRYDDRSPGRGDMFLDAFYSTLDTLNDWPESGSPDRPGYRRFNIQGYPYIIYYMVMEDRIWIACVKHASRHPDCWIHRRPR